MRGAGIPIVVVLLLALSAGVATPGRLIAEESAGWPGFLGPRRAGVALDPAALAISWPEEGPPVRWRRPLGEGFSGIAAVGGRLYTMAAYEDEEYVLAFDAATGTERWRVAIGPKKVEEFGDGPRSTPTVVAEADGGVTVYAAGSAGRLLALAADDGTVRWQVELAERFGGEMPPRGYACSPLAVGDLLVIETGGTDGKAVAALDRATGETRWTAESGGAAYSSPVLVELAGVPQLLLARRTGPEVVALSLAGEPLWRHPAFRAQIVPPVALPGDRLFFGAGEDGGVLIEVRRGTESAFEAAEVWSQRLMRSHFNPAAYHDGALYGFDNATLKCLDAATGEPCWAHRGLGKGSLIVAGDRLIILGDRGQLMLAEATPEELRILAQARVMEGKSWTAPALAGGTLFLRDQDEMVALDLSAGAVPPRVAAAGERGAADEPEQVATRTDPGGPGATSPDATGPDATGPSATGPAATGPAATGAPTLEQILARHAAARGGRERWREVDSLRMTGTYVSFSEAQPFTLELARPRRYRFETVMLRRPLLLAQDESGPWWVFPLYGVAEPGRTFPQVAAQVAREADLEPPLLAAQDAGEQLTLLGRGEIQTEDETIATWRIERRRPDGWTDSWHLSADSYLEVAADATVHDFTQTQEAMPERTWFDDFEEVDGLMIPHRIEREYWARHTLLQVEKVEIDPEIAPERFEGPPPAEEPAAEEGAPEG